MRSFVLTFLLGCALALTLTGCGKLPQLMKVNGTTAVAVTGAYRGLDIYDAKKMADIQATVKTGKPAEAEAQLNAYLPKYRIARTSVDVAAIAVEESALFIQQAKLMQGKARQQKIITWIATLTMAGADVVAKCAAIGIKIPGGAL